jgi:glycosyltransferase involved in cell wall biosynthesis
VSVAPTVGVLHLAGDAATGERRNQLGSLYRSLGAVLTPSEDGRRQVTSELGVSDDRVHVVPNGVSVPALPAPLPHRQAPRIGALGRLTAQKGFDLLIDAVRSLVRSGVRLEVVIGGAGRDETPSARRPPTCRSASAASSATQAGPAGSRRVLPVVPP